MTQADISPGEMVPTPVIWPVTDPTAQAILRQWANRPWEPGLSLIFADRADELGQPFTAECVRQGYWPLFIPILAAAVAAQHEPRRARQRALARWREWLKRTFGDFDENPLPCEEPADTPSEVGELPF